MTKQILILMSDTGGGHRSSADALSAGFTRHAGAAVNVRIIDLLRDHLPFPFHRIPAAYPFLVNRTPRLWHLFWRALERDAWATFTIERVAPLVTATVARTLADHRPDLILSVHPMVQHITAQALARSGSRVPFCTVVTDLATAHRAWFHPAVTRCFVAGPAAQERALAWGIDPARLRVTGLPIRAAFTDTKFVDNMPAQSCLRRELGVDPRVRLALVLGGGDGVGNVSAVTQRLADALRGQPGCPPRGQLAVICGRNQALQRQLTRQHWPVPVHVRGYVENMHAWMHAADCVVTKAGPGTIAEALACGRPLLLTGFIPGQEEGNVDFVVQHGAGAYCPAPPCAAETVTRWFAPDGCELEMLSAAARRLARPDATDAIVREVLTLL